MADGRRLLRRGLRAAALAAAASCAVVLIGGGCRAAHRLRDMDARWLPALLVLSGLPWAFSGMRMKLLASRLGRRLPWTRCTRAAMCAEFGLAATPAGIGGPALRTAMLGRLGLRYGDAAAVVLFDAATDLALACILTPLALRATLNFVRLQAPSRPTDPRWYVAAGALVVVLILTALVVRRLRRLGRLPVLRRAPWYARARTQLHRMRIAMAIFWRRGHWTLLLNMLLAAGQWACRYSILPLICVAFGLRPPVAPLMFLQMVVLALGMFLIVPGGVGGVEALMMAALSVRIPAASAGAILLVWRFFTYHVNLLGGALALFSALRAETPARGRTAGPPDGPAA
jgi:uncharacterized protein (TIRG00374 family)